MIVDALRLIQKLHEVGFKAHQRVKLTDNWALDIESCNNITEFKLLDNSAIVTKCTARARCEGDFVYTYRQILEQALAVEKCNAKTVITKLEGLKAEIN